MVKAPPKSTTYGNKGRGKTTPKKQPSPTPNDDSENKEEDSIVGKLLDELDDDAPPAKARPTRAKAPAPKPKPVIKPTKKVNPPSLPPASKVIPKSKLSKEIKASPPSKSTSKGNDSESEFDTDEEEEKVKAKSRPKPIKGKKEDSSKLPSSNGLVPYLPITANRLPRDKRKRSRRRKISQLHFPPRMISTTSSAQASMRR